ncbi:MAG: metallophosphoesterase [Clostridia bacterium]|nr:metallophosphoesterase [Clostridia bacterium]MBQ8552547.1 metallophosphoesterase [Clostridia bacterium]
MAVFMCAAVSAAAPEGGLTFTADDIYVMESSLVDNKPKTFSAWVKIPGSSADSVIVGSYRLDDESIQHGFTFGVNKNGQPNIFYCTANANGVHKTCGPIVFSSYADGTAINVENGEWTHVAMTVNTDSKGVRCYVNGIECYYSSGGTITELFTPAWTYNDETFSKALILGGDYRTDNTAYCKGAIGELVMYGEVLTSEQISSIYSDGVDSVQITPMAHFDLESAAAGKTVSDISGNGHHFYYMSDSLTVSFDANGGDGTMKSYGSLTTGAEYTLPACTFKLPYGKYFKGWALSRDGEVITDTTIKVFENITLYAIWDDVSLPSDGMSFTDDPYYVTDGSLSALPYTYSLWLYVPEEIGTAAGAVWGNWKDNTNPSFIIDIQANGVPRFYHRVAAATESSKNYTPLQFKSIDVRTGDWAMLTFTVDAETNKVTCYLNDGEGVTGALGYTYDSAILAEPFVLGGTRDPGNDDYFHGALKEMVMYGEALTADEVAELYNNGVSGVSYTPIAHYDLENAASGSDIADASDTGNDLEFVDRWVDMESVPAGYAYSMAVVGDTQIIARDYPEKLDTIYDWILDNRESKNIRYVIGLGDITDDNTDAEWTAAQAAISQMDGVIPYSLIRGNHDTAEKLNEYFANDDYMRDTMGFYAEKDVNNSYDILEVGDDKYLLLNLNYSLGDAELEWVDEVLTTYHDHKVIVSIHSFLCSHSGTRLTRDDACNPSMANVDYDSAELWENVFSKYENIFLILGGHDPSDDIMMRQDKGVNGNTVTQLLINPQYVDAYWKPSGMVAMMYFYPETNEITVEYYSTIQECYFKKSNRYTISLGEETEETKILGDANADGKTNSIDLAYLQRHLANWSGYADIALDALDLDNSGNVDITDAMVFARHLARWIGYELLPYTGASSAETDA